MVSPDYRRIGFTTQEYAVAIRVRRIGDRDSAESHSVEALHQSSLAFAIPIACFDNAINECHTLSEESGFKTLITESARKHNPAKAL